MNEMTTSRDDTLYSGCVKILKNWGNWEFSSFDFSGTMYVKVWGTWATFRGLKVPLSLGMY